MVTKRKSLKSGTKRPALLGKPNGIIQPRVQAVGPERFGIVAVDCAKARCTTCRSSRGFTRDAPRAADWRWRPFPARASLSWAREPLGLVRAGSGASDLFVTT